MAIFGLGASNVKDDASTKSKKTSTKNKNTDDAQKNDNSQEDEAKALLAKMEVKDGEDCPFC